MEFKDKLKKLRAEAGISQQALADAIFVSRSAVAKWENGLGLPSSASSEALAKYFGVSEEHLKSNEADEEYVEKNQRLQKILTAIFALLFTFGLILSSLLTASLFSESWGLTPELCADPVWHDNPKLDFDDYDFYISTMDWHIEGKDEVYPHIAVFLPVRKEFIGYSLNEEDYRYRKLYFADSHGEEEPFAILYSIKGKNCYYNFITSHATLVPKDFISFGEITVNGKETEVQYNSFFISEDLPFASMTIGDTEIFIYADVFE